MQQKAPEEFLSFAEKLADVSGQVIRRYFRAPYGLSAKDDLSPVTLADLEAEREMRAVIEKTYPQHGIIGEEFGSVRENADYVWTLDPVDGTASFIIGRPIFGTLISLLYKGKPILGVIDQPITKERWIGNNENAWLNGEIIQTRKDVALKDSCLLTTSHRLFEGNDLEFFEKAAAKARYTIYGGDCYLYGLVAMGQADLVIESGLKIHDFCALGPIVKGGGGSFTDWHGNEVNIKSEGRVIASGSKELAIEVIGLVI